MVRRALRSAFGFLVLLGFAPGGARAAPDPAGGALPDPRAPAPSQEPRTQAAPEDARPQPAPLDPRPQAAGQDTRPQAALPQNTRSQAADASGGEVRVAFSSEGRFGAWLVAGPFERSKVPEEDRVVARFGAPIGDARWTLASTNGGPVDLVAALDAHGTDLFAYASGVVHIEHGGRHLLLLGADDGVSVDLDGKRVYTRDDPRPQRDDDDLVPLDLAPGDHAITLLLHQRAGAWSFRTRLLDAELEPPRDAYWLLPGTGPSEARALALRMSTVSLDRGMRADGYRPSLTVRYVEGAPERARLDVHARLTHGPGADDPLFDVDAGEVATGARGVRELSVSLPRVGGDEVEDGDWTVHVEVAGRALDLPMHPRRAVREAVAHADRALQQARDGETPGVAASSLDSVEFLRDRLAGFVSRGDSDISAELDDARELEGLASALDGKIDPYAKRTGVMRRAYRSPADGKFSEFALYVPHGFDHRQKYPLIVALHGMNGYPMEMLMWFFGHDDPNRDAVWEDRHPRRSLDPLPAIVVAPSGHYNAMYRDVGEEDVMRVIDWAIAQYPIDLSRVTVTGPSMGGIGTAACALHYPDRFAAAEPLCGYHSFFVRGDSGGMRPWERFLAETRSNVLWAENGQYLPLYIVHGTKDLPEENSGVLIDRYDELHYDVKHEHPELGHNVWQTTYEDLKGAHWLLDHRRPLHPRAVRFKTARARWGKSAWVRAWELASSAGWGEINARIDGGNVIHAATKGLADVAFERDPALLAESRPVTVWMDQSKVVFPAGEDIELHRTHGSWKAGEAPHERFGKRGTTTGPLHDIFQEPILFVWGASDPAQARANEEVARAWARVRNGVRIDYPVLSDTEFFARGEPVANDRALFLVGNARSNRVVRELEPNLPIHVDEEGVLLGTQRVAMEDGPAEISQLGAAFIHPNPERPDHYVVVVEGVGALGTWRSLSLPEMLPDYVVYDRGVAPARGGLMLGAATLRSVGYFTNDWSLPAPRGSLEVSAR
ncbi:MAG: prolyl oligopeptidase family serine peptidase [Myxococcales bacterium]|nr:prolyl oligopeptidase family serine peptidase [Myxococcales bacterium]